VVTDAAADAAEEAGLDAEIDAEIDAAQDAAIDAANEDGGHVMCGTDTDLRSGATCPDVASGVYAIKTVIDVWWYDDAEPPIIDPGRGFITLIQKATLTGVCEDGSIRRAELQHCGLTLPPTVSWPTCSAFQLEAPDALWDSPSMPRLATAATVTGFEVGDVLSLTSATGLIGIDLLDSDDPWPTSADQVSCDSGTGIEDCFPDHDGDVAPGVRFGFGKLDMSYRATGCGVDGLQPVRFERPRTDALGLLCPSEESCARAAELDVGMRVELSAAGAIAACSEDTATLVGRSSAESMALRAGGCVRNDGMPCTGGDTLFVDSMLQSYSILAVGAVPPPAVIANPCDCASGCAGDACPLDQTPSAGPRTAMVRLGDVDDAIDCAAVRTAIESAYPGTGF
jgi:hypothetical protein